MCVAWCCDGVGIMPAVYVEVARRCMRGGCTICLNVDGEGGEVVPRFFVYIKADAAFGAMFRCGRCAYAYRSASICNVPNGADNRDILQERGGGPEGALSLPPGFWVLGFGFWVLGFVTVLHWTYQTVQITETFSRRGGAQRGRSLSLLGFGFWVLGSGFWALDTRLRAYVHNRKVQNTQRATQTKKVAKFCLITP